MNNKFLTPLLVSVSGGDDHTRVLLTSQLCESLRSYDYKNVTSLTGANNGKDYDSQQEYPPLSVYNIVKSLRPDMFNTAIIIQAVKDNLSDCLPISQNTVPVYQRLEFPAINDETKKQLDTEQIERENIRLQNEVLHLENTLVDIFDKIQNTIDINNEG